LSAFEDQRADGIETSDKAPVEGCEQFSRITGSQAGQVQRKCGGVAAEFERVELDQSVDAGARARVRLILAWSPSS